MKKGSKARYEERTGIDVSPLIDMVFILLVFFVVTTVFVKELGLPARTLVPDHIECERTEVFALLARSNGQVMFNGRAIPLNSVGTTLQGAMMGEMHPVKIEIEEGVFTDFVVRIIDECYSVGIEGIILGARAG